MIRNNILDQSVSKSQSLFKKKDENTNEVEFFIINKLIFGPDSVFFSWKKKLKEPIE